MSDDEIKARIIELKCSYPKMAAFDMWFYNFDNYQISFRKIEKIFYRLSDKLNYIFWGVLISYGYFYIEISNYKEQIKRLRDNKKES